MMPRHRQARQPETVERPAATRRPEIHDIYRVPSSKRVRLRYGIDEDNPPIRDEEAEGRVHHGLQTAMRVDAAPLRPSLVPLSKKTYNYR